MNVAQILAIAAILAGACCMVAPKLIAGNELLYLLGIILLMMGWSGLFSSSSRK